MVSPGSKDNGANVPSWEKVGGMLSWLGRLAFLSAMTLLTGACTQDQAAGPSGRPAEKIPVTVYFQGALTGRYNYLVIQAFRAARLRFDELNAEANFPAEVTLERANFTSDWVYPVVETVVGEPNTVAIIGPMFGGESEGSGDAYNEAGIPFITPSATSPELADNGWDYWYRTVANNDDQGPAIGERMAQEFRSIYVAYDKYEYARRLAEVVAEVAGDNGADVVAVRGVEATEDYSALIRDIDASRAEALFYGGYDAQTGLIAAQARDAGLDIPIWSGDGSLSEILLDVAGNAATNIVLSCPCNLEGSGDFLARYEAEYGETAVPIYAAEGYDAASLIGEGIRSAVSGGATDPTAIREEIKEYLDGLTAAKPFEGVAKEIAFDPETHELTAEDRRALIFFYTVEPGVIILEGSAAELVTG
jgi:branched-chain amino acid transport system substrate-binding protein